MEGHENMSQLFVLGSKYYVILQRHIQKQSKFIKYLKENKIVSYFIGDGNKIANGAYKFILTK